MNSDTIAAISTGLSSGGISIIRISGKDAYSIIDRIYQSKDNKKTLSKEKSHTLHYGFIIEQEKVIDEVMVAIMKAPHTYTKEDVVEIDCHGGIIVTKRILEVVLNNGARLAEPGEFTKRAFLNGRIDLSQAEAVMDIIQSKNDMALKNSMLQLNGKILKFIEIHRENILRDIAFIEAALDDPEHISLDGFQEILSSHIENEIIQVEDLIRKSKNGKIIKEGIRTVIIGKPNAGKSSLLNYLLGEERAIVTDIAGTTRDTLEETVNLNGIGLNLMDTAGIRSTDDVIEKIGVQKAIRSAENADLIIYVVDSSTYLDENDKEILNLINEKKAIILLNKSDLEQEVSIEEMEKITDKPIISISVKENIGLTEFEDLIKKMFYEGEISLQEEIYITNERHREALQEAFDSLKQVKRSLEDDMPEDFYTIDLMSAYTALGKIIGENVEDDLVNMIFKEFCMGK